MKAKKQDPKTVILPDDVKSYYRFSYDLTYEEAYAAFSALAFKRGGNYRLITGIALTVAAVIMLVTYAMDSTKIMNLILALTAVLLLFYLVYTPVLKAKKVPGRLPGRTGSSKSRSPTPARSVCRGRSLSRSTATRMPAPSNRMISLSSGRTPVTHSAFPSGS